MKDIKTFIREHLESKAINEGLKDVTVPRKGSYVFILRDGDTKVQKVHIENVIKRPMGKGWPGSFTYIAELADNEYGLQDYAYMRFKSINYTPKSVDVKEFDDGVYYFGVDAKSINDFVKADAGKKLENVLKKIEEIEANLAQANEEKAKLEAKINNDITESLLEGKEAFVKFTLLGCDESKKAMEKIAADAQSAGIYFEKLDDNSFKLKLKPGQDWGKIKAALEALIDGVPEDKKEEAAEGIEKINKSIDKADEAVKEETAEDPEKKDKEGDKKEEE